MSAQQPMKMFIWRKNVLVSFSSGLIVVVAESKEKALTFLAEKSISGVDAFLYSAAVRAIDGRDPDEVLDLPAAVVEYGGD